MAQFGTKAPTTFKTKSEVTALYPDVYNHAIVEVTTACAATQTVGGSFHDAICADFDVSRWHSLNDAINDACGMPGSVSYSDSTVTHPLSYFVTSNSLCKSQSLTTANDIPGGVAADSNADSLMGFLTDSNKYVTFSANAPPTEMLSAAIQATVDVPGWDHARAMGCDTLGAACSGVQGEVERGSRGSESAERQRS